MKKLLLMLLGVLIALPALAYEDPNNYPVSKDLIYINNFKTVGTSNFKFDMYYNRLTVSGMKRMTFDLMVNCTSDGYVNPALLFTNCTTVESDGQINDAVVLTTSTGPGKYEVTVIPNQTVDFLGTITLTQFNTATLKSVLVSISNIVVYNSSNEPISYASRSFMHTYDFSEPLPTRATSLTPMSSTVSMSANDHARISFNVLPYNLINKKLNITVSSESGNFKIVDQGDTWVEVSHTGGGGNQWATVNARTTDGSGLEAVSKICTYMPSEFKIKNTTKAEIMVGETTEVTFVASPRNFGWLDIENNTPDIVELNDNKMTITGLKPGYFSLKLHGRLYLYDDVLNLNRQLNATEYIRGYVLTTPEKIASQSNINIDRDSKDVNVKCTIYPSFAYADGLELRTEATNISVGEYTYNYSAGGTTTIEFPVHYTSGPSTPAKIKAYYNGTPLDGEVEVNITPATTSMSIDPKKDYTIRVDEYIDLGYTFTPATAKPAVDWSVSSNDVLECRPNGDKARVYGRNIGVGFVNAATSDSTYLTSSIKVQVLPRLAESISFYQDEITRNFKDSYTYEFRVSILPAKTSSEVLWELNGETEVGGLRKSYTFTEPGEYVVTAKTTDGTDLSAKCTLKLERTPSYVEISGIDHALTNETLKFKGVVYPLDAPQEIEWSIDEYYYVTPAIKVPMSNYIKNLGNGEFQFLSAGNFNIYANIPGSSIKTTQSVQIYDEQPARVRLEVPTETYELHFSPNDRDKTFISCASPGINTQNPTTLHISDPITAILEYVDDGAGRAKTYITPRLTGNVTVTTEMGPYNDSLTFKCYGPDFRYKVYSAIQGTPIRPLTDSKNYISKYAEMKVGSTSAKATIESDRGIKYINIPNAGKTTVLADYNGTESGSTVINTIPYVYLIDLPNTADQSYFDFEFPSNEEIAILTGVHDNAPESVALPTTVTNPATGQKVPLGRIAKAAFNTQSTPIQTLYIPGSVELVLGGMFRSNIKTVIFGEGHTEIPERFFESSDIETIYFPQSMKIVSGIAFEYTHLKEVYLLNWFGVKASSGSPLFDESVQIYISSADYKNNLKLIGTNVSVKPYRWENISLGIAEDKLYMNIGETVKMPVISQGFDENESLTWCSYNPSIATVDQDGVITACSTGSVPIFVEQGPLSCVITVNVNDVARGMCSISPEKVVSSITDIDLKYEYSDGTTEANYEHNIIGTYKFNPNYERLFVTEAHTGNFCSMNGYVTLQYKNESSLLPRHSWAEIYYQPIEVSEIVFEESEIKLTVGDEYKVEYSYAPYSPKTPAISLFSDNLDVLQRVGPYVRALKPGKATVIATDGIRKAYLTVYVLEPDQEWLAGDSNDDWNLSVSDIVNTAHYLVGKTPQVFHFKKADMDRNGNISIADVTSTVDAVLEYENYSYNSSQKAPSKRKMTMACCGSLSYGPIEYENDFIVLPINISSQRAITGIQMDVKIPAGLRLTGIKKAQTQDKLMVASRNGENYSRIIAYNPDGTELNISEPILYMMFEPELYFNEDVVIASNIIVSDVNATDYTMESAHISVTGNAGIIESLTQPMEVIGINDGILFKGCSNNDARIITANGIEVNRIIIETDNFTLPTQKGIYLVTIGDKIFKVIVY